MHKDYLGTILAITDEIGKLVEERHFDAWGNLTHGSMQVLDRGYTSHEHLLDVGLIHMNGRLYDPMLRRFLNADEYIQDPTNTQCYNKYGYVMNNPLMFNDPSGEYFIGSIISAIIDAFGNVFTHGVNFGDYDWNRTQNGWKIDMGYWQGNFGQILNRFGREGLQTDLGYMLNTGHNWFGGVKQVSYYNEATVIETYSQGWGGVTLGSFIMGEKGITNSPNDDMFQHEYGHVLQSQFAGILYLPKFAIPSVIDAAGTSNHNLYETETDANARAFAYFYSNDASFYKWDFKYNPIPGYDDKKPFNDPDNIKAIEKNTLGFTKFESFLNKLFSGFNFSTNPFQNNSKPCDGCK